MANFIVVPLIFQIYSKFHPVFSISLPLPHTD